MQNVLDQKACKNIMLVFLINQIKKNATSEIIVLEKLAL